jgi:hypothetical protein
MRAALFWLYKELFFSAFYIMRAALFWLYKELFFSAFYIFIQPLILLPQKV